jgi:hypothetical protein
MAKNSVGPLTLIRTFFRSREAGEPSSRGQWDTDWSLKMCWFDRQQISEALD